DITDQGKARGVRASGPGSGLQKDVHQPGAAEVLAVLAAVSEDVGIGATRIFEGVGQNGQRREVAIVGDVSGEADHLAVVPAQPARIDGDLSRQTQLCKPDLQDVIEPDRSSLLCVLSSNPGAVVGVEVTHPNAVLGMANLAVARARTSLG